MISIKPEIEDIINDKFMRKIQPGTAIYDVNPPSMYGTINEPEKKVVETGNDNIIYKYLSNDTLNKVINVNDDTEFNYVLYNIVDDSDKPYVKFLMNNDNNIMKFPNEKGIIENIDSDSSSDSDSDTDDIIPFIEEEDDEELLDISSNDDDYDDENYLPEQCSQYIEKHFGITDETSEDFYKGYVNIEDKIYIFIDTSIIHMNLSDENQYSWVIIDEIIHKKSSNNTPICKIITQMFTNNSDIQNIYDENNDIIESPICVYICQYEDEKYTNIETTERLSTSLVSNKVSHDVFGNITMFSTIPILNGDNYKRYGLFTSNANYILHTNFTRSEVEYIKDKSCVRFAYNNVECWAVKDSSMFSHI